MSIWHIIVVFVRLLGRTVTYHPRHTGGGIHRCAAFHFSFDMHSDDSSDADVVSDSPFRMYVVCYVCVPIDRLSPFLRLSME